MAEWRYDHMGPVRVGGVANFRKTCMHAWQPAVLRTCITDSRPFRDFSSQVIQLATRLAGKATALPSNVASCTRHSTTLPVQLVKQSGLPPEAQKQWCFL